MLVDLRNHGESDHHNSMKYTEMDDDLVRFIDSRELETVTIIGHNMGAKTAMACA
jgi:esterase